MQVRQRGAAQSRTSVESWKGCTAVTLLRRAAARGRRGVADGTGMALKTKGGSHGACARLKTGCRGCYRD